MSERGPRSVGRTAALCAAAAIGLAACTSTDALWREIEASVAIGNFDQALELTSENQDRLFGNKGELLFNLERGMLWQMAGRFVRSNSSFEAAKEISEELYTKSLTGQLASFTVNDRVLAYRGENFERALVHVLSAINYALLGDPSAATVEARQVDALLSGLQTDTNGENVYREDAFARYVSALLFEERGRLNDAVVSYRQALAGYVDYEKSYGTTRPEQLLPAALAAAEREGVQVRERMEELYGEGTPRPIPEGHGELVLFHYNGWAPRKRESFFEISFGEGWAFVSDMRSMGEDQANASSAIAGARAVAAGAMLRVAFPTYVDVPYRIATVEVASPQGSTQTERVEDIRAIARRSLEDRRGQILARAAARAAFKFAIAAAICSIRTDDQGAQLAVALACAAAQATRAASERADTRSWRTLPGEIGMALLPLPPGTHELGLNFLAPDGAVVEQRTLAGVQVESGRRTFAVVRTVQ